MDKTVYTYDDKLAEFMHCLWADNINSIIWRTSFNNITTHAIVKSYAKGENCWITYAFDISINNSAVSTIKVMNDFSRAMGEYTGDTGLELECVYNPMKFVFEMVLILP